MLPVPQKIVKSNTMHRRVFLPRTRNFVAHWRAGDEVFYQRTPSAKWQRAIVQDVIIGDNHTFYRISIDHKVITAKENQLGYPIGRRI